MDEKMIVGKWYRNLTHKWSYMKYSGDISGGVHNADGFDYNGRFYKAFTSGPGGHWGISDGYTLATEMEAEMLERGIWPGQQPEPEPPDPQEPSPLQRAIELLTEAYAELRFHDWHNTKTGMAIESFLNEQKLTT